MKTSLAETAGREENTEARKVKAPDYPEGHRIRKREARNMVRVGIIGCGRIAQVRHIPEYQDNPDCQIVGYFDLNEERAKQLAEKFGGKVYHSYQEMLEDPEIDAVSVCTANCTHAEISIAAMEAGKNVLCEKPMAMSEKDCEAVDQTVLRTKRIFMVDHNQRFTKAHQKAKELIDAGEIGKILTFRTIFGHKGPETWSIDPGKATWFFDKKRAIFGAMADLGIHKTDIICYLVGSQVAKVSAVMATLDKVDAGGNKIGVDDNVIAIYTMKNGVVGTMTASWTYYGKEDNSTTIYGTNGCMKIYYEDMPSIVIDYRDGTRATYDMEPMQTNDQQTKSGVMDEFIDCVKNYRKPEVSADVALAAMRAIFAAQRSSEEGREVETGN